MAPVLIICLAVTFGILVVAALIVGIIYSRRRAARRRLRAAQNRREARPRRPEALPPHPDVWNHPPAEGTVLVRNAEELRQLCDVVRVEAVEDDVDSTDLALTRPPSRLFGQDDSQNASVMIGATPGPAHGGGAGSDEALARPGGGETVSMPPTPLASPSKSRVFGGHSPSRRAARGATDLVISADVRHPHSGLYQSPPSPHQPPPLPSPAAAAAATAWQDSFGSPSGPLTLSLSLPPVLPAPRAESSTARTPYEKNLAQQHQTPESAPSDVPTDFFRCAPMHSAPVLSAFPSTVVQVPSTVASHAMVVDHFQTPPAMDRVFTTATTATALAASSSLTASAARPLFARAPVAPLQCANLAPPPPPPPAASPRPLGTEETARSPSAAAFSAPLPLSLTPALSPWMSMVVDADLSSPRESASGKSGNASFALVGSLHPCVKQQPPPHVEHIARRLLVPLLEQSGVNGGAESRRHSRTVSQTAHAADVNVDVWHNAHYLSPAGLPLPARSLSFADSTPVFAKVRGGTVSGGASHEASFVEEVYTPASTGAAERSAPDATAAALFAPPPPLLALSGRPTLTDHDARTATPLTHSALASPTQFSWQQAASAESKPPLSTTFVTPMPLAQGGSSRPVSRQASSLRASMVNSACKRSSTAAAAGKKHLKRLRHVHRGGFIMFEQPPEDAGPASAQAPSRPHRVRTGVAVATADNAPPSDRDGDDAEDATPDAVNPPQAKRYYFEKPSSVEVYGRATYTDPNAEFLRSLDGA